MAQCNWEVVVARQPKGYVELNDQKWAIYGPIKSINITEADNVQIVVEWAIKRPLGKYGIPVGEGKWEVVSQIPLTLMMFPNLVVPFVIENIPEMGDRVRFADFNILYFNVIEKVSSSDVEGLQPTT